MVGLGCVVFSCIVLYRCRVVVPHHNWEKLGWLAKRNHTRSHKEVWRSPPYRLVRPHAHTNKISTSTEFIDIFNYYFVYTIFNIYYLVWIPLFFFVSFSMQFHILNASLVIIISLFFLFYNKVIYLIWIP